MRLRYALIAMAALWFASLAQAAAPLDASQMLAQVRTEVAKYLGKPVDVDKPLEQQGADKLDLVEIVMMLEEKFGIEIPDSALGPHKDGWPVTLSVRALADYLHRHQKPVSKP